MPAFELTKNIQPLSLVEGAILKIIVILSLMK